MLLLANAGLPMFILIGPAMILLIIPVILLEWWVSLKMLQNGAKQKLLVISAANIVTTAIGWPLLYIAWIGLAMALGSPGFGSGIAGIHWPGWIPDSFISATLGAPWLMPYEDDLWWMIPTATITFLIPCFFLSVWIEGWICKRILRDPQTSRFAWLSHQASYGLLTAVALCSTFWFHAEHVKENQHRDEAENAWVTPNGDKLVFHKVRPTNRDTNQTEALIKKLAAWHESNLFDPYRVKVFPEHELVKKLEREPHITIYPNEKSLRILIPWETPNKTLLLTDQTTGEMRLVGPPPNKNIDISSFK
jgi:hypothetical protein